MKTPFVFLVCMSAFFAWGNTCYAQNHTGKKIRLPRGKSNDSVFTYDYVPANKVIFEDDFSKDAEGTFPAKWENKCPDCQTEVKKISGKPVLDFVSGNGDIISARIPAPPKADMYMTFDCDYKLVDTEGAIFKIVFGTDKYERELYFTVDNDWFYWSMRHTDDELHEASNEFLTDVQGPFDRKHFNRRKWHHFAVCFTKTDIKGYVDDHKCITLRSTYRFWVEEAGRIPETATMLKEGFFPTRFTIGGQASYLIRHVRFAESSKAPKFRQVKINDFNRLLSSRKMITHDIFFQTNSADIRPESIVYLQTLAAWLNKNRTVKLEIDGYTDNDGSDDTNLKLSQARADEVKNELVSAGVNEGRLTSKGYGAANPIQPNTTPEGKAENRRVEFIRK